MGIKSACESFELSGESFYYLTMQHPYIANTVSIYVNGELLDSSLWYESAPTIGVVYVSKLGTPLYGCASDITTVCAFDTFSRVVSNDWNTSNSGILWEVVTGASDFSVDGDFGLISWSSVDPEIKLSTGPWQNDEWTMNCKFLTGAINNYDNATIRFQVPFIGGGSTSLYVNMAKSSTSGSLEFGDPVYTIPIDFDPDTWYFIRWYYNHTTGTHKAKLWKENTIEPNWMLEEIYGPGDGVPDVFRINGLFLTFNVWDHYDFTLDYIDFYVAPVPVTITVCYQYEV